MKFSSLVSKKYLKKLWDGNKYLVCITVEYDQIKLIAAERGKPCTIFVAVTQALPADLQGSNFYTPAGGEFLKQLLAENALEDITDLVAVLGDGDVVLQQLSMPEMPASEMAEAVHWDMLQYVPWGDGDYYSAVTFTKNEKDKKYTNITGDVNSYAADFSYGQKQVVAAAAQAGVVDGVSAVCAGAGLNLLAVTADTAGQVNFAEECFTGGAVWGGMFCAEAELQQIAAEYGGLIAAATAYNDKKLELNLLPVKKWCAGVGGLLLSVKLQKAALACAVLISVCLVTYSIVMKQMAMGELEAANGKLQALDDVRLEHEKQQYLERNIKLLTNAEKSITESYTDWHKILAAVSYASVPNSQVLELRQNTDENSIELIGKATTLDAVTAFNSRLAQIGLFSSVQLGESGAEGNFIHYTLLLHTAKPKAEVSADE